MRHLRPIKSFGQSFLTYEPAADRIVDALGLVPDDEVIEIGPGKGILTSRLIPRCRRVIAVEVDRRLVDLLRHEFGAAGNLEIIHQDILEFDFSRFQNVKLCSNLPYNISSQILFRLLDFLSSWKSGVFTLQRELALRMTAQPGTKEYGAVTVLFELDTVRTRLFNLPPEYFKPRPDVVSTVISMARREQPVVAVRDRARFRRVVKAAFAQRRKTLANNLAAALHCPKTALAGVEQSSGVVLSRRAETVTVDEFARLSEAIPRVMSNIELQISNVKREELDVAADSRCQKSSVRRECKP